MSKVTKVIYIFRCYNPIDEYGAPQAPLVSQDVLHSPPVIAPGQCVLKTKQVGTKISMKMQFNDFDTLFYRPAGKCPICCVLVIQHWRVTTLLERFTQHWTTKCAWTCLPEFAEM